MNRNYFNTPPITLNLLIINVLVFAACYFVPAIEAWAVEARVAGGYMPGHLILFFAGGEFINPLRLITYMFLHANFSHLFFNMFSLWMFGRILEQALGSKRFLLYYFVCGVGAGLIQLLVCWVEWSFFGGAAFSATLGASGAVFGILLAFGMLFPNERIMLLIPPIPMKAKWFVIIYGAVELAFGIGGIQSGVAHFAHLGGMLFGFGLILYWKKQAKKRRFRRL